MSTPTPSTPAPEPSSTPRTDAEMTDLNSEYNEWTCGMKCSEPSPLIVSADFARELETELNALRAELDAAKAALEQERDSIAHFTKLHMEPGRMEAHIAQHPALKEFVAKSFAAMLLNSPNYTELKLRVNAGDESGNVITVLVQKQEGKTPHEKRVEAEQERDAARAELAAVKEQLTRQNRRVDELEQKLAEYSSGTQSANARAERYRAALAQLLNQANACEEFRKTFSSFSRYEAQAALAAEQQHREGGK